MNCVTRSLGSFPYAKASLIPAKRGRPYRRFLVAQDNNHRQPKFAKPTVNAAAAKIIKPVVSFLLTDSIKTMNVGEPRACRGTRRVWRQGHRGDHGSSLGLRSSSEPERSRYRRPELIQTQPPVAERRPETGKRERKRRQGYGIGVRSGFGEPIQRSYRASSLIRSEGVRPSIGSCNTIWRRTSWAA